MKRQWYYRGSLKSCNYACSYCPFSKRKGSARELQEDQAALFRFIEKINRTQDAEGAVQIVPYGEALIHPYYWEGLANLSQNPRLEAVGAQSNFSFPLEQMLSVYCAHGGVVDKLRLWGTFHPQMTSAEQFAHQCRGLSAQNILYCAGAVGVPANLKVIRRLREMLPASVYLWINKMDGLGRAYTASEIRNFLKIDDCFDMELAHYRADTALCADSRFVEADGTMRRCNLSRQILGNFYDDGGSGFDKHIEQLPQHRQSCGRKECSCYLSYCNRSEEKLRRFLPYPAFRLVQPVGSAEREEES